MCNQKTPKGRLNRKKSPEFGLEIYCYYETILPALMNYETEQSMTKKDIFKWMLASGGITDKKFKLLL